MYLLGGASAGGSANDTRVVYTPAHLDPETGIYVKEVVLPHGTFCSDHINPPSELREITAG